LVGVFTLVSLASSDSQEDTEALLAEILQLVVVLDAVKKTTEGLRGAFKLAQGAAKNFGRGTKRALAATGIGLLVVAIGAVVVAFDQMSQESEEAGEDAGDGISFITKALNTLKAAFATAKVIAIDNIKLIGLALSGLLLPIIVIVRTIQNIKTAFDEGKTGLDAFKDGFVATFEEGKKIVEDFTESIKGAGEEFEKQAKLIEFENQLKQLDEAIKLTNGLNASNASLAKQQASATEDLKERLRLERLSISLREEAITQELTRFGVAKSFRSLTAEEQVRQNDLQNQLKGLSLERTALTKANLDAEEQAKDEALQKDLDRLDAEAELRRLTLEATITDAELLNRELLGVEQERQAQRLAIFTAGGEALALEAQKEGLELLKTEQQITDAYILELQARDAQEQALIDEGIAKRKKLTEDALAFNKSIEAERNRDLRKARNEGLITEEEFSQKSLDITEVQLAEEIELRKRAGQETFALESQLLDLQQKQRDETDAKQAEQRTAQLDQFKETAQTIADIVFLAQEAQINKLDQLLESSQSKIDTLNQSLDATRGDREQIESDIADTQGKQREANATLDKELREQLNAQRVERVRLVALEKQQLAETVKAEEEKAELEEQKAEREKKLAKQQANLALALALVESAPALVKSLSLPFPASLASFAAITALIGKSIATAKQASQSFATGGLLDGPSHADGGIRGTGRFGNVEVEGGEMIINKRDTARNMPLLSAINSGKKVMAGGGVLTPSQGAVDASGGSQDIQAIAKAVSDLSNRPMVVGVTDISEGLNRVSAIDNASQL
jgi:hypothetical protein